MAQDTVAYRGHSQAIGQRTSGGRRRHCQLVDFVIFAGNMLKRRLTTRAVLLAHPTQKCSFRPPRGAFPYPKPKFTI